MAEITIPFVMAGVGQLADAKADTDPSQRDGKEYQKVLTFRLDSSGKFEKGSNMQVRHRGLGYRGNKSKSSIDLKPATVLRKDYHVHVESVSVHASLGYILQENAFLAEAVTDAILGGMDLSFSCLWRMQRKVVNKVVEIVEPYAEMLPSSRVTRFGSVPQFPWLSKTPVVSTNATAFPRDFTYTLPLPVEFGEGDAFEIHMRLDRLNTAIEYDVVVTGWMRRPA